MDALETLLKEYGLQPDNHYQVGYFNREFFPVLDQVLQNHISDLAFLQNQLRDSGINYYFTAAKEDENRQQLKLADNNVFFDRLLYDEEAKEEEPVLYNPESGLLRRTGCQITSLRSRFTTSPRTVASIKNLGDGMTQSFQSEKNTCNGTTGQYIGYSCEGKNSETAQHGAQILADYFDSGAVSYEGKSNIHIFRPGEKVTIINNIGRSKPSVLLTEVFHHFRQNINAARGKSRKLEYANLFWGLTRYAEVRPDPTEGKMVNSLDSFCNHKQTMLSDSDDQDKGVFKRWRKDEMADTDDAYALSLQRKVATLKKELAETKDLCGIMVGTVIEDAKVTGGSELTCKVANEKFPEGITIKVALGWLTQQGWLSLLPRKDTQVYFQFLNGEGGRDDAVLVGYRPTSVQRPLDPAKDTETADLTPNGPPEEGKPAKPSVESASFMPVNKHRLALRGENGVAEIAVIDGGEDSVTVNADNRIGLTSKKSISISTGGLSENANTMNQSFKQMFRNVDEDEYNIASKHTQIVGSDRLLDVGTTTTEVDSDRKLIVGATSTEKTVGLVKVSSDECIYHVSGDAYVKIEKDSLATLRKGDNMIWANASEVAGAFGKDASKWILKADGMTLVSGDSTVQVNKDGTIKISGKTEVKVTSDTKVVIDAADVEVKGKTIVDSGDGGKVEVAGGMVKLNC